MKTETPETVHGSDSPTTIDLPLTGIHCAGCVSTVEGALRSSGGVGEVSVDLATSSARVRFDPARARVPDLVEAVRGAGYDVETEVVEAEIGGMHCASCVASVEEVLRTVPAVLDADVNLATGTARIRAVAGALEPGDLTAAVGGAGYELALARGPDEESAGPGGERRPEEARDAEARELFRRFVVGALLTVPVLLLGHHEWVPGLHDLGPETLRLLWGLSGLLTIPIMTYVGRRFFVGGWAAFRRRNANMDTLVALGTGSAWLYSTVAVLSPELFPEGTAHPFYEATAVVITLVVLGQALEARAKGRTSRALRSLLDLRPRTARVVRDGVEQEVPVAEVGAGEVLVIRPGERIPVDGEVLEGASAVDEAMVTGESIPVEKGPGDEVIGGTLNRSGTFRMRATRVGRETVLAQIVELVREAQASKPPIQRMVDTVSSYFVPVVMIVAVVTFALWYTFGPAPSLSFAVVTAVAVLVIACPCALGLATPISVMIAVGKAAENGILVRNGEALQKARRVDTVVLDKTGTLTSGEPVVTDVLSCAGWEEEELLSLVAAAELGSEHPLGSAIVAEARARGVEPEPADRFEARPGKGVSARVRSREVLVGTVAFLGEEGVDASPLLADVDRLASGGKTPVLVAVDGRGAGVVALQDLEKPDSAHAVRLLREAGLRVVMLTGDHERTAAAIARRVGIDEVLAGVLPEAKAEAVARLQDEGRRVAMVGDGVNDAPALAQADVGIAIGSGTDVAMETADVTLMGGSLVGVVHAIELSRVAVRNMRQNLFGAFVYNVLAIPIAAGLLYPFLGLLLNPMIAGAAMAFSSVTVVTNANRLRGFRPAARVSRTPETRTPATQGVA